MILKACWHTAGCRVWWWWRVLIISAARTAGLVVLSVLRHDRGCCWVSVIACRKVIVVVVCAVKGMVLIKRSQ